jgi:hypothetical protein
MKLQEDHFVSRINMKDLWLSNLLSLLFAGFTIANTYQTVLFDMENFIFCTVTLLSTAIGLIAIYYHLIYVCFRQAILCTLQVWLIRRRGCPTSQCSAALYVGCLIFYMHIQAL